MSDAPGWDALDQVLGPSDAAVRFDVEAEDGVPSIASVLARRRDGHWLYATYGLTDLYEKSTDDRTKSGHGYELVLRVEGGGEKPESWPAELLRAVARYVESSGAELADGHYIDAGEPLGRELETKLTALVVVDDPELAAFDGPFGRVKFLELVGIANDELELLLDWSVAGLRRELAQGNPLLVTKPARESLLESPRAQEIRAAAEREGSSLERLSAELWVQAGATNTEATIALESTAVDVLRRMLRTRLAHERPVLIDGVDGELDLVPGDEPKWQRSEDGLRVTIPRDLAVAWQDELAEQPGNVVRPLMSDLWVRIVQTGG